MLSSGCTDGILDGKEDGGGQEERRLPDSLGGTTWGTGTQAKKPQPPQQEGQ